jgi:hemolysin activation/secretion protein
MRFPLHFGVLVGIITLEILPSHTALATPAVVSSSQENLQFIPSSELAKVDEEAREIIHDNFTHYKDFQEIDTTEEIAQQSPPVILSTTIKLDGNSVSKTTPQKPHFLQPIPTPKLSPEESPLVPTPIPEPSPETNGIPISVQRIEVNGSTVLTSEQIESLTKPLAGKTVYFQDITNIVNVINQLYAEQGYTSSRAVLEPQIITNSGVVQIRIIEGSVEKIEVEGTQRLNPNYVISRIKLGVGTPLNTAKLEEQLRLLRRDPLFKRVEAKLRPGSGPGKSILVVEAIEHDPLDVTLSVDNYSPPSVGSERLGVNARYLNVTGIGDIFTASYYHTTTGGADSFDFTYRVPVNVNNGTLQLRAAPSRNHVTQQPFKALDIHGESQLYEISYRQPIVRSFREELALSVGFTYQSGQTFTFAGPTPFGFGPDERGINRTSVIKFGQDYVRWDNKGAWALGSQFSFGTGLLNATENSDPIPDGHFFSWIGQVQRLQRLSPNNILHIQGEVQLTPDSLLSSQQFIIGGGESVRGYRQNVRAGDNGVRFSIEDRITIKQENLNDGVFELAPFAELGVVWNATNNPNYQPKQTFLASVGLGLIWQPNPNLNIRLDYGLPLINLDDRGNNAQDDGFYFSVKYQF